MEDVDISKELKNMANEQICDRIRWEGLKWIL